MIITEINEHVGVEVSSTIPDQYVSEAKKQSPDFAKRTLDYFFTVGMAQLRTHRKTFIKNYDYVKGNLTKEDFFIADDDEVSSFTDELLEDVDLPSHVKHYSIFSPPMNTLIGELINRPDHHRVKAFDDDSRQEELEFRTNLMEQFIIQEVQRRLSLKMGTGGQQVSEEEFQALTLDRVEEEFSTYTSIAEMWGNKALTAAKMEFNLKELSEDTMRDSLICAREFTHIAKDRTKTGFFKETLNPAEVWVLMAPDKKYTCDQSGREGGAYASGFIKVLELSEITQRYELTEAEVKHLRDYKKNFPAVFGTKSNIGTSQSGIGTVNYHTYDKGLEQLRLEGFLDGVDNINFLNNPYAPSYYDNKFHVLQAYWAGKQKIGRVRYFDEELQEVITTVVDENYEKIPTQVGEVEWEWITRWYSGVRIGESVYKVEPLEIVDYNPIIGVFFEPKNLKEPKSLIDLIKPFQTLYNICMNQLYALLDKEIGNVQLMSIRHIPTPKDGDSQDAIELWKEEAKKEGVIFIDDSPENLKGGSSFQTYKNIDLTRTNEIQSRYALAVQIKQEAWELIGITKARSGAVSATKTATGVQTELSQSYAQTEPLFAQHEYVTLQRYQAILDAMQHIAVNKPNSTISFINNAGDSVFFNVNSDDLKFRDLKCFVTSRPEDIQGFNKLQQLGEAMLQNGAEPYDVSVIYTTNSVREMRKTFKKLKEDRQEERQRAQQMEERQIQAAQQMAQAEQQAQAEQAEIDRINDNYNKELDRISQERIAIIRATGFGQVQSEDQNADGIPDVLEASRLGMEQSRVVAERNSKERELAQRERELMMKRNIELEKIKERRENQKNDLQIEKIRLQAAKEKSKNKTK